MNKNPFIFGKPVNRNDFYNRKEEVENAKGFLKRLQSCSGVGERRIGKTSFIRYVLSREILREYGVRHENHIIAFLSLSSLYEISKELLIGTIVEKIGEKVQVGTNSTNVFDEFRANVRELTLKGKNLIIALDEFEVITPILDDNFSHWLRFIFQEENVVAITASQTTVRELETSGGTASPLFNIFGNIFLDLFERNETENMIIDMFRKGGMELEEDEVAFLADLSGGNPYFVSLVGYHYYEEKKKKRIVAPKKFKEDIFPHANDQFESYWKHLTKEEKKFLVHSGKFEDNQIGSILKRKGLISLKGDRWEMFSLLFREFVNRRARTDEDLVFD